MKQKQNDSKKSLHREIKKLQTRFLKDKQEIPIPEIVNLGKGRVAGMLYFSPENAETCCSNDAISVLLCKRKTQFYRYILANLS